MADVAGRARSCHFPAAESSDPTRSPRIRINRGARGCSAVLLAAVGLATSAAALMATPTTMPTPIPTPFVCDGVEFPPPVLEFDFNVEPPQPVVGDSVTVTVTIRNVTGGFVGRPLTGLFSSAPILSGNRDGGPFDWTPVSFELLAVQPGTTELRVSVTYEARTGCCGHCYTPGGQASPPFTLYVGGGEPLPDLVPTEVIVEPVNGPACVNDLADYVERNPFPSRVCVRNVGGAAAGRFVVEMDGASATVDGLNAGAGICVPGFLHRADMPTALVRVDAEEQVVERNEDDNERLLHVLLPSLPPACGTPTRTPIPDVEDPCCRGSGCCGGPSGEACTLVYGASGTVRDAVTSLPIAGARITVLDVSGLSAADGSFNVGGSRADTCNVDYYYSIAIGAPGYRDYRMELYTSAVFPHLDIALEPSPTPTPTLDTTTLTPTPTPACPFPAPTAPLCPVGQEPECVSGPCLVGCRCKPCPPCPFDQVYSGYTNRCDCVAEPPSPTPTPSDPLPDLIPDGAFLDNPPPLPECVEDPGEYITRNLPIGICILNRGNVAAAPFDVLFGNGQVVRIDGLASGNRRCITGLSHPVDVPVRLVEVDSGNEVAELNEDNNRVHMPIPLPPQPPACDTLPRVVIGGVRGEPGQTVTFDVTLRTRGDSIAFVDQTIGFDLETAIAAKPDGNPDCSANALVSGRFQFLPVGCAGVECEQLHARIESTAGPLPDAAVLYRCAATITEGPAETCDHELRCIDLAVGESADVAEALPCQDGSILSAFPRQELSFAFAISPERPLVGDRVELSVSVAAAQGGLPLYVLRGAEPFFAGDTASVSRSRFGTVTYELHAVQSGTAVLSMSVDYETTLGCPGYTFFGFVGDESQPFVVEIGPDPEASPTPTATATPPTPPPCPTATPVRCPSGQTPRCEFRPCAECRCEDCPPCPDGEIFVAVTNSCACAEDTALPPVGDTEASGGSGGGCAIGRATPSDGYGWLLACFPALLLAVRRYSAAGCSAGASRER